MNANRNELESTAGESLHQRASARRRLLRGTFAVPTVLTLSSGSALAATSSLRCFANAPLAVDSPPSNYFRVQRFIGKLGTETTMAVVKGSEISGLAATNGFLAGAFAATTTAEIWFRVSDGFKVNPSGNDASSGPKTDGTYVALRLDRTGGTDAAPVFTVTGLAGSSVAYFGPVTARVMTHSCWASI